MRDSYQDLSEFIRKSFGTGSTNAIECCIFLYTNDEKAYSFSEIFNRVKNNIASPYNSPERTFATEIRKYTDNSPQELTVSLTKLFTITDFAKPQKIELIKNIRGKINEFYKSKAKNFISNKDFLNALNDLLKYSQIILNFFRLKEENKNSLVNEIYKKNTLDYFKSIETKINKGGPIQALRYKILSQFINDKEQNLENTRVSVDFIKSLIDELCTIGFKKEIFNKSSFDASWTGRFFVRVLLYFYDYKFKVQNKKKFLTLIKFLLIKFDLEEYKNLIDLDVDQEGRIKFRNKDHRSKTILLKKSGFSIIDFEARSNNKYNFDPWIAIFPSKFGDHQKAYQIFLNINPIKNSELKFGLHPGSNVITNICRNHKRLEEIHLDFTKEKLINEIMGFYSKILSEYENLNLLEDKYSNFKDINCWFASPEPPKDEVYENNMFVKMMGEGYFALGWPEFQVNMSDMDAEDIKNEWNKIDSATSLRIKNHIFIKEEMKKGDIIIAKKGDNPSNPNNRIYGIGYIKSDYKFDKDLDPYKATDNHYRDVIWIINFYNDNLLGIIQNPYLDLKEMGASLNFDRTTLVKKNYDFYLSIKKAIKLKLKELREKKLLEDKIYDNYIKKFQKLEDTIRCIKASLSDEVSNSYPPLLTDIKKINLEKLLGLKILKFLKREMNIYEEEK